MFCILSPKDKRIKVQRTQHNEFVESELETRLQLVGQQSQWVKDEKKTKINRFCAKKILLDKVQGEWFLYIFILDLITITVLSAIVFFSRDSQMILL